MIFLNVLSLVIFLIVAAIVYFIGGFATYLYSDHMGLLIIYMILWLMLHELLHGIGFSLFKEVNKKNITFDEYYAFYLDK